MLVRRVTPPTVGRISTTTDTAMTAFPQSLEVVTKQTKPLRLAVLHPTPTSGIRIIPMIALLGIAGGALAREED